MGGHLAICSILKKKQENRQKESSGNWFSSHRNDHKPKSNNEDKFEMFLSSHLWLIYAVILEFEFLFRVLGIVGIPRQLVHALSKISAAAASTRMEERNSKIPPSSLSWKNFEETLWPLICVQINKMNSRVFKYCFWERAKSGGILKKLNLL